MSPPLAPRGTGETLLANLAANFPELIDKSCKRATMLKTDPDELIEWLENEFKKFTSVAQTEAPGSMPRIGRTLLDWARNGKPPGKV